MPDTALPLTLDLLAWTDDGGDRAPDDRVRPQEDVFFGRRLVGRTPLPRTVDVVVLPTDAFDSIGETRFKERDGNVKEPGSRTAVSAEVEAGFCLA